MINPSLILVPSSCRDSEVSITLHHPGEAIVILKTVQGLSSLSFTVTVSGAVFFTGSGYILITSRAMAYWIEGAKRLVMRNYGVIMSLLIHMLLLSIPLSATVTRFPAQGFGDVEFSLIDGGVSPAGTPELAVSGGSVERKEAPRPPETGRKAEEKVRRKKEMKPEAASRQPGGRPEAAAADVRPDAVRPAEKEGETEVRSVTGSEEEQDESAVDMPPVQAEDGGQGPVPEVKTRDAPQGGASGKPAVAEFGSAEGPAFVRRVIPEYPWMARRTGREGRVLLKLTIDETGRLLDVVVVEKAGYGFDREAVRAVRRSTFRPAVRNGIPVKSEALLYVRFELEER